MSALFYFLVCFLILMQYCSVLFPYGINSPHNCKNVISQGCLWTYYQYQYSVCLFKEESRREKTAFQMWWQSRMVDQSRKAIAIMSITDFVSLHVRPFSTLTDTPVSDIIQMDSSVSERGECEIDFGNSPSVFTCHLKQTVSLLLKNK